MGNFFRDKQGKPNKSLLYILQKTEILLSSRGHSLFYTIFIIFVHSQLTKKKQRCGSFQFNRQIFEYIYNTSFICKTYTSSKLYSKIKLQFYSKRSLNEERANHLEFLKLIWLIKVGRYCLCKESVQLMTMQDSATRPLNHVPKKIKSYLFIYLTIIIRLRKFHR